MKHLTQQIIERLIATKSFLNDYPKPGVVFLAMDSLFSDADSRKVVSAAVSAAIDSESFDKVAGIASRGYVFSSMISSMFENKGENFIQKVKVKGDARYVQIDTTTEYSSDALQVLKDSFQKGKKYLLTDDLIATGGSVLSAIKLIRECGGLVDKVFVMTELQDFAAREKLKEAGVELVSLLSLSNQDLQKLLLLQQCYQENTSTPLTYKLSNHEKDNKAVIQSNHGETLKVHLASKSPIKHEAAEMAFKGMFDPLTVEVFDYEAQSCISDQPFGREETLSGAKNRIASIEKGVTESDNDILVSIENGLRYAEGEGAYYDFVHVIVKQGDNSFTHVQDCCRVTDDVIHAMLKDKENQLLETWGEAAQRMNLVESANDPHQDTKFGGVSRKDHVFKALCQALGKFKEHMMGQYQPEIEDQQFNISRLVSINHNRIQKKYAKRGVFFAAASSLIPEKAIDLYNHGCPVEAWEISPEKAKLTTFKVFTTGDAFSVVSQAAKIKGKNINIHAGVEHEQYSPLVLLQEALQLCRCVYEHGVEGITVSLPEQFHPALHPNDFNLLLMSLFKASGANKLYFYSKNYLGELNQANINEVMPLRLSQESDEAQYKVSRKQLLDYLHFPKNKKDDLSVVTLDEQVMHFTRRDRLQRAWDKFDVDHNDLIENIGGHHVAPKLTLSEVKDRLHILLSCSANKPLAEKIAQTLRDRGEAVQLYHVEGEGHQVRIPKDAEICGAVVTIVQSTRPNPDNLDAANEYQVNGASKYFFESAMIAWEARLRGAEKINLINPYQNSARSDKAENNAHGKTGSYVQQNGRLLEAAGVNHVVTAECHDVHTLSGSYTGKSINGSAVPELEIMSSKIAHDWINQPDKSRGGQLRLVAPDAGATKRTKELTTKLQAILGDRLSNTRILGDKQRDSHEDDSAIINGLSTGSVAINAKDKYLITDDETATGSTLCQAISTLAKQGAKDIVVALVHNNMPLDWLQRQLCLARFIYIGANDLHFSDTQEMGTLAKGYNDLIASYSKKSGLSQQEVEKQVLVWFESNCLLDEVSKQAFERFKGTFNQLQAKISIHSLADEFAKEVCSKPVVMKLSDKNDVNLVSTECSIGAKHYRSNNVNFTLFNRAQEESLSNSITLRQ